VRRLVLTGFGLTALAGGIGWWGFGVGGAIGAGSFGLLATAVQVLATRRMLRARGAAVGEFLKGWGVGMGLRLLGVAALLAGALLAPGLLPPLPAAIGYLGVLFPLMILEARLIG